MNALKPISGDSYAYKNIIATGGIGSGIFFQLQGNETLGREESRMGKLLPYRDYCKQHIILHYISVLLGRGNNGFQSHAIGKVGNDATGRALLQQMQESGIVTANVSLSSSRPTLFSVCYLYPDHAGGNITTSESSSGEVSPEDIDLFFESFHSTEKSLILAVPEVPVSTRIRLLEHGRRQNAINISSSATGEIAEFKSMGGFELTDFLFINLDEARHIANQNDLADIDQLILKAIQELISINASITVFITCGALGVYCYHDKRLEFFPAIPVEVVSTAGAGDAFLAGTVAGICCGLPLLKIKEQHVLTATEVGILVAALSVTSPHTIHPDLDASYMARFVRDNDLPAGFQNILPTSS